MTLEKAIEISTHFSTDPDAHYFPDLKDAIQLGIEALKRCQLARKETSFIGPGPLPGETKE